jgi:hypothetical protein
VSSAYVCVGMSLCIAKPVNSLLITNQDLCHYNLDAHKAGQAEA